MAEVRRRSIGRGMKVCTGTSEWEYMLIDESIWYCAAHIDMYGERFHESDNRHEIEPLIYVTSAIKLNELLF